MVKYAYARFVVAANRKLCANENRTNCLSSKCAIDDRCCRVIHTWCRIQSRQVINEDNQHRIKLSTDKQHIIIGMHNLERKHTTDCRMGRDTRLMTLGGKHSPVSIVASNRGSVVDLCRKDESYTRVRNKRCFRIVKGG